VIIVIGSPIGRLHDDQIVASGTPARAAMAAGAAGSGVQLLGKTGDDATADGLLLDLTRGGVGHVALLRDPARVTPLEPDPAGDDEDPAIVDESASPAQSDAAERPSLDAADVDLGLRYLTDFASWSGCRPGGGRGVSLECRSPRVGRRGRR